MAIKDLIAGKPTKEKGTIKGIEIAKTLKKKRYKLDKATKAWK